MESSKQRRYIQCCKHFDVVQRLLYLLAVMTFIGVFSGCTHFKGWLHNGFKVGPNYAPPATSVADQWIDYNGRHVICDCEDDSHWWTVFGDPQLDMLIDTAHKQNLSLREAGMRVLEARARRCFAIGSILPQDQRLTTSFQRINVNIDGNTIGVIPDNFRFDLWQLGGKFGWELDIWGKFRRMIESADAELEASVEDYDDMLVCLLAETATAYVDIRTLQHRIELAEKNVRLQEETVRIVKAKVDLGAAEVTPADLTQTESLLSETRASIPVLQAQLRAANNRLCVLLGQPPSDLIEDLGVADVPTAPRHVSVGIPADLLRRRPDIRKAERMVAAQSARIGVAASELFPQFSLLGTIAYSGSDFSDMFNTNKLNGAVGPSIDWKIFHYGRLLSNIRLQDAKLQQAAYRYQETVLRANAEVEDALIRFVKAQEETDLLKLSVKSTQSTYDTVKKRVTGGAEEVFRLNEVQKDLVRRQDNLAVANSNIALQLIQVYKGLGGGWQIRTCQPVGVPLENEIVIDEPLMNDSEKVELLPGPMPQTFP